MLIFFNPFNIIFTLLLPLKSWISMCQHTELEMASTVGLSLSKYLSFLAARNWYKAGIKNISEKRSSLWSSGPQGFKNYCREIPQKAINWQEKTFYFSIRTQPTQQLTNKMVLSTLCWFLLLWKRCIINSSHSIWKIHARKHKLPS